MTSSNEQPTFIFNVAKAKTAKNELGRRLEEVSSKVKRVTDGFNVSGFAILGPLLQLTRDPTELRRISKALARLAPLIEEENDLSAKLRSVELAESNPGFFAWAFGDSLTDIDFTFEDSDLDDLLSQLGTEGTEES